MTIAIVSSPRDTKNKVIQGRIETGAKHKRTNDQTSKNLSSISYTNKELGVGGIHMKQKHDFYLSNLGRDLCIRYLPEKKKKQRYRNSKPKTEHVHNSRSSKASEWPLMSSPISKSILRKTIENESKVV